MGVKENHSDAVMVYWFSLPVAQQVTGNKCFLFGGFKKQQQPVSNII